MRDTQRGTQLHGGEKREEGIEVPRRRRGGIKRGEGQLASNHFPMCSPQSGSLRDVQELHRVEKKEERDRGDQEEERGSQKERDRSSQ